MRLGHRVAPVAHIATLGCRHRILCLPELVVAVLQSLETAVRFDLLQRIGQRLAIARLREGVVCIEPEHGDGADQQRKAKQQF
jgi:hypothetical protein